MKNLLKRRVQTPPKPEDRRRMTAEMIVHGNEWWDHMKAQVPIIQVAATPPAEFQEDEHAEAAVS